MERSESCHYYGEGEGYKTERGGGGFYHYEKGVGVGKVLAMLKGGGGVTTSIGVVLTR